MASYQTEVDLQDCKSHTCPCSESERRFFPSFSLSSSVSKLACVSKEGIYGVISMLSCFYFATLFKIHGRETWKDNLLYPGRYLNV